MPRRSLASTVGRRLRTGGAAVLTAAALATIACRRASDVPPLFDLLPASKTGVEFANVLPESADFNILNYLYYYNGGGVATGDVNGDGLPDLYFTANVGPNRLYLNRGGFRFEDVTARAGVADSVGWKTGVTMADVNGDGRLDIYVSAVSYLTMRGRNVLYVNNGDGTFADRTTEYGLDQAGYSTQAAFFDYDGDGDLDVYLLTHSTHTERSIGGVVPNAPSPIADRLMRNDPAPDGSRHFVDVSEAAGIHDGPTTFGLGIVVSDLNSDGCPDIYVANDFQEDDRLYVNRCDGTFVESLAGAMGHTSRFSMGVDAGDIDGDGRPDLFVADMLPEREDILKTSASSESYNLFNLRLRAGYHPQYARNALQLNRGPGAGPGQVPSFSEIGYLAGVAATDWSWAPLFADLDNDGRLDLFITNGIYRRPNDLDYINYVGNDAVQAALANGVTQRELALLKRMPQIPLPNYAFRNDGALHFTNATGTWGLAQPGFSNGAAYVDLDNDGALDLVVNNVGAPASVYHNRARERTGNAYLTVALHGAGANTMGIGAKVFVKQRGTTQLREQMPTRGFESSVDPRLHFGLGRATLIDSLVVVWPDGRAQVLTNVTGNRLITLSQDSASGRYDDTRPRTEPATFDDVTRRLATDYRHAENDANDFDREPLMPHLLSTEGPALATGDVNGDGLDDLYVGGAKWQRGRLLLQRRDGTFRESTEPALAADSLAEDVDAAFFDADGDGHTDLVVASGGNEFWGDADALRPRLYLNDGAGHFRRSPDAFPGIFENGGCIVPGDFDGDGHVDLFLGSRVVSRRYGQTPTSHLLRNDGRGRFIDVTRETAPALGTAGMVSSATWVDVNGDRRLDLVVVGEWMPVRVFRQEQGRLVERTTESGLGGSEGWWNSVSAADVNGDGRPDLVLGNLGLNAYITASANDPARLYVSDFAHNGALQQVLTFYKHGVSYPMAGRDELVRLIPSLRSRYPSYADFGASKIGDIFPDEELRKATVLTAHTFANAIAINGGGTFTLQPLPVAAQLAPVYASVARDFDGDGRTDLLLAGNFLGVPPMQGRYDASAGVLLHGLGDGHFTALEPARSRLAIDGQVRHMAVLRSADGSEAIAIAKNAGALQLLRIAPKAVASGTRAR